MDTQNQVVFTTDDITTLIGSLEDSIKVSETRLRQLATAIETEIPLLQAEIQRKGNLLSLLRAKV